MANAACSESGRGRLERFKHNAIGIEHLLLGLIYAEGGIANRVLHEAGIEQTDVEELVSQMPAGSRPTHVQPELSAGAKRTLELAADEARRLKHSSIDTEHLLIGLVRQTQNEAIDILKQLGVRPEDMRRQTRQFLERRDFDSTSNS